MGRSLDYVRDLAQTQFGARDGALNVGGLPLRGIVEQFGTPLYVYDADIFRRKLARLRRVLPEFDVHYSVKANPNPSIMDLFLGEGCGLEIASGGELALALACHCPPRRILFAGPGKTDTELEAAVRTGVGEIHAESHEEIDRLGALAARTSQEVRVAIRINPDEIARGGAMNMGGRPSPFGLDEGELPMAAERVARWPSLDLSGLHVYCGTQILDREILLTMYRHTLDLAVQLARSIGRDLRTVDFGGGLGVPYFEGESELDLEGFAQQLRPMLERARREKGLGLTRFVIEPGRYLVAEGGIYVARVVSRKVSRGASYLVLDGGMNHHLAATGALGQVIRRNFPIAVEGRLGEAPAGRYDVVGPLCTPLDALGRGVTLPHTAVDDLVVVFQSGAYGLSASPVGFLSHPAPCEVMVDRGEVRLIRRRGQGEDLLRGTALDKTVLDECVAGPREKRDGQFIAARRG